MKIKLLALLLFVIILLLVRRPEKTEITYTNYSMTVRGSDSSLYQISKPKQFLVSGNKLKPDTAKIWMSRDTFYLKIIN